MRSLLLLLLVLASRCECTATEGESSPSTYEVVEFRVSGEHRTALGNVLVEAEDGGILLQAQNQTIWPLQPEEIVSRKPLEQTPEELSRKQLAESVRQELGRGFRIHETKHYIICYNTSMQYAKWSGALFERLHRAFVSYWERRGIKLKEPPPLVACVFRDKGSYQEYGREELGKAIDSILGYYSYKTNRIAMYDLTAGRRLNASAITKYMRTERTIATVVHEATHQLAFNSGLHQRFADIPLWLSEGMAIYFETPDFSSGKGWKTIGNVNQVRLQQFVRYARGLRRSDSLQTLVASDDRFQILGNATEAYAESWAFCYFLAKLKPKQLAKYLKILQEKDPLIVSNEEQRLADFVEAFGATPNELNRDFMSCIGKLRY